VRSLLLITVLTAACIQEPPDPIPGQLEAETLLSFETGIKPEAFVWWHETLCPYDQTQTAVIYKDLCYHGIVWSCYDIHVARRNAIGESALIHELAHCHRAWLWSPGDIGDPGDYDHEDEEWWIRIEDVEAEVRRRGL